MGSGENHEQEESMRKRQVFGAIERMHSRRGHLEKQGESEECNGISRRIQEGI